MVAVNGNSEPEGEKVNTNIVTLTRFLTEEQVKHKEATGDFTYVPLLKAPIFRLPSPG
jgi:fructose-1,6-bisphosphatase I